MKRGVLHVGFNDSALFGACFGIIWCFFNGYLGLALFMSFVTRVMGFIHLLPPREQFCWF